MGLLIEITWIWSIVITKYMNVSQRISYLLYLLYMEELVMFIGKGAEGNPQYLYCKHNFSKLPSLHSTNFKFTFMLNLK